jgi:hypothetical protein
VQTLLMGEGGVQVLSVQRMGVSNSFLNFLVCSDADIIDIIAMIATLPNDATIALITHSDRNQAAVRGQCALVSWQR